MPANFNSELSVFELSTVSGLIYDACLTQDWQTPLNKVMELTASDSALLYLRNTHDGTAQLIVFDSTNQCDEHLLNEYRRHPFGDPFYLAIKDKTPGNIHIINKLMDTSLLAETHIFETFLRPMGFFYALGGVIFQDSQYQGGWIMRRWLDDKPYGENELQMLHMLSPHMARAIKIVTGVSRSQSEAIIAKSILDSTEKLILVCTSQSQPVFINQFGEELIQSGSLLSVESGHIRLTNELAQARFERLVRQISDPAFKQLREDIYLSSDEFGEVLISVSPVNGQQQLGITSPCCLVTLTLHQTMPWSQVQREADLTAKELEILRALYKNKKLNDLTVSFGVTYNTLRTHLQHIFKKFHVNSQAELMMKLSLFKG